VAAVEAREHAHILRRPQPRRAFGFERSGLDPHAAAPGFDERAGSRLNEIGCGADER